MSELLGGLIMMGAGMFAGFMLGTGFTIDSFHAEAIKRGFAYYDPVTREFKWKEPTT